MKWSHSAHTAMRRCQRQLAIGHFMASHSSKNPDRREAYVLKQLQHLSAWQGSVVHEILATEFLDDLRRRRPVDPQRLAAKAVDLANRQFAFSAAGRYREPGLTKGAAGDQYCALFEHEFGLEVKPEDLGKVHATIRQCYENLAGQHDFLAALRAGTNHMAERQLFFRLDGVTVTAQIDLLFRRPDGQATVVDWKIAQSETSDYSSQLLVYALAVARATPWEGIEPESIELYEVNLLKNRVHRHTVTASRLDEAEDFVYRSITEMRGLVGSGKFEDLDLAEFEVAAKPQSCAHCNLRGPCIRLLEAAGRPAAAEVIQGRLW